MTTPTPTAAARPRRPPATRRRTLRRFIPPQHGAWAILLLPWLVGAIIAGFVGRTCRCSARGWPAICSPNYLLQAVKTRRPGRVRTHLLVYAGPTVLLGGLVLALRPALLWYAPAHAVNLGYAARRNERALANDPASVAQSCLMVFVCASVSGAPLGQAMPAFLAVTAYFTGTVLYVKTMIRERGHAGYRRASVVHRVAILAVAAWWREPVAVLFAALLARAALLPSRRLTPDA